MRQPVVNERYRIGTKLGEGGMGRVFRARDLRLQRTVAIKILPRIDSPVLLERFHNEALAVARLNHPGIVTIYDYDYIDPDAEHGDLFADEPSSPSAVQDSDGPRPRHRVTRVENLSDAGVPAQSARSGAAELGPAMASLNEASDGARVQLTDSEVGRSRTLPTVGEEQIEAQRPFIVMEYLPGRNVSPQLMLGVRRIIEIVIEVCDALEYAHQAGIIHRDIKPENVRLLTTGRVKLLDFGVAILTDAPSLTNSGELVGTVQYMSPEQALGKTLDLRTDVYSLGIMLYELLTGTLPFSGPSPVITLSERVNRTPPPLRKIRTDLPHSLERVVHRAMSRNLEERYPSARAFADVLRTTLDDLPRAGTTAERGSPRLSLGDLGVVIHEEPLSGDDPARASTSDPAASTGSQTRKTIAETLPMAPRSEDFGLVGRDDTLAALHDLLEDARGGNGGSIFIGGEPGAGKSAILAASAAMASKRSMRVRHAEVTDEESAAFTPIAQLLRTDLRQHINPAEAVEPDADLLVNIIPDLEAIAPGITLSARSAPAERGEIAAAFLRYVERATDDGPILLIFEDFHDADEASVTTLRLLLAAAGNLPLAIVVGHCFFGLQRDEPFHGVLYGAQQDRHARRIELHRLEPQHVSQAVQSVLPVATEDAIEAIASVTDGHPGFLDELLDTVAELSEDEIARIDDPFDLPLPKTVAESVRQVFDGLSTGTRSILQAAATIGREFDFDTLCDVTSADEEFVIDALEQAKRTHLLKETDLDSYRFDPGLSWQTIYRTLHPRRRARYHQKAAHLIEAQSAGSLLQRTNVVCHLALAADRTNRAAVAQRFRQLLRHPELRRAGLYIRHQLRRAVDALENTGGPLHRDLRQALTRDP